MADSAQNDPHKREYYLAQIPFTPEQLAASNLLLEDGLHHAGVIFKDELDNLPLAEKHLRRLTDHYRDYEHIDETYYHLFLLYSRLKQPATAENYVDSLKARFPDSQWTTLLTDPYFVENAKFGKHIEDSLYAATYEAFKKDRFDEVTANASVSETRFPLGANRDKFLFISGLSRLNDGDAEGCVSNMKQVVEKYPRSRISEMAGMIVNGVNQGRQLHGGKFDLGDIWTRRAIVLNDSDSIKQVKFTPDRDIDFVFMLVYSPDSLNENKLLFEIARFNFTNFLVRNFEIQIEEVGGMRQMRLTGFLNFEEAYEYARQLFANQAVVRQTNGKAVPIIISAKNEELIGKPFSYKDYEDFYAQNFNKVELPKHNTLFEPADLNEPREPEKVQPIGIPEVDNQPVTNEAGENEETLEVEDDTQFIPIEEPSQVVTDTTTTEPAKEDEPQADAPQTEPEAKVAPAEPQSETAPQGGNEGGSTNEGESKEPAKETPQEDAKDINVPEGKPTEQPKDLLKEPAKDQPSAASKDQPKEPQQEDNEGTTIAVDPTGDQPAETDNQGDLIEIAPEDEPAKPATQQPEEGTIVIPDEPETPPAPAAQPPSSSTPKTEKPQQDRPATQPQKPVQDQPQGKEDDEDEPEFFFEGDTPSSPTNSEDKETLDDGLDDEYYELDGF